MFQGFCNLGDTFNGVTLTKPASLVPTNADSLPTARVYSQAGYLMNATVAFLDQANVPGGYQWTVVATCVNGFLSGQTYFVVVNYKISGTNYASVESFAVA